jgi:hypothetical protein
MTGAAPSRETGRECDCPGGPTRLGGRAAGGTCSQPGVWPCPTEVGYRGQESTAGPALRVLRTMNS